MTILAVLASIAVLVGIDRVTKLWTVANLTFKVPHEVIPNVFYLTYDVNDGAAYSILSGKRWFLIAVSVAAFAAWAYILIKQMIRHPLGYAAYVLVAAGALGNFIDRVFDPNGYVIDMFDFRLINFGIFNVADVFIVAGTILTVIYVLFLHDKAAQNEEKSHDADSQSNN